MECIKPGIYLIRPQRKCLFPYSNSLYIKGETGSALIDAGAGMRSYGELESAPPGMILLTHFHFDHNNSLQLFPSSYLLTGREETWAYCDESAYVQALGYEQWETLMGTPRDGYFGDVFEPPDDIPVNVGYRPIHIDGSFVDGDRFDLGGVEIEAVHTPGHTPGHYAFFLPASGVLFSGDIDLAPWGPWYSAEVSDFDDMVNSIERLRRLKPQIIISSHRQQVFTENLDELLLGHLRAPLEKEQHILRYLQQPHTFLEIAGQEFVHVYPTRTPFQEFWNRMMLKKHLDRLVKHGAVRCLPSGHYLASGF